MRKFLVSLALVFALAFPIFAQEKIAPRLPKTAKLSNGTEVVIPYPDEEWHRRISWDIVRATEGCRGLYAPDTGSCVVSNKKDIQRGDIVVQRIESFLDKTETKLLVVHYAADTDELLAIAWTDLRQADWWLVLLQENGAALAGYRRINSLPVEERMGLAVEPVFKDRHLVGVRAYLKYGVTRIAERVYPLPKKTVEKPER